MIREATPADLPRLRAIQLATLDEPWDGLLEPAIEGPPSVLVSTPDDPTRYPGGADAPVGYAVAIPEGSVAYLAELAVAASAQRTGHGSALLDALASRLAAAGFERMRLTVAVADRDAREFYAAQGFEARALLPEHYESGDGMRLTRALQASTSN